MLTLIAIYVRLSSAFTNFVHGTSIKVGVIYFGLSLVGVSIATFSMSDTMLYNAVSFLVSPVISIHPPVCLTFKYFLRSHLKFSITNETQTRTLISYHMDGGFDFHQVWLDLPRGRFQLLWETQSKTMDPAQVVKIYHAAVGNIEIIGVSCTKLRKLMYIYIYINVL